MALIALSSGRGAPGTTTTALALALVWPRPTLLVEADVTGGSSVLAGYLRGAVSPHARSLLALASAHRRGLLDEELWRQAVPLDDGGRTHLLPAITDPAQAAGVGALWAPLGTLLAAQEQDGVDVIIDAGRLGAAHGPEALLAAADITLLVTRTQLPAVATARTTATAVRRRLDGDGADPGTVGLLVVGDGRPYTGRQISKAVDLPVLAALAWDPGAAEVLSLGAPRPRHWDCGTYVRSVRSAVDAVAGRVEERRSRLGLRQRDTITSAPTAAAPTADPAAEHARVG